MHKPLIEIASCLAMTVRCFHYPQLNYVFSCIGQLLYTMPKHNPIHLHLSLPQKWFPYLFSALRFANSFPQTADSQKYNQTSVRLFPKVLGLLNFASLFAKHYHVLWWRFCAKAVAHSI